MISKLAFTATGLLVALCLVSPTLAAPVVIDTFSSHVDHSFDGDPLVGTVASPDVDPSEPPPNPDTIAGGDRDYSLDTIQGTGETYRDISRAESPPAINVAGDEAGTTYFRETAEGGDIESLLLTYDGIAAAGLGLVLDPTLDQFVLDVTSLIGTYTLDIRVEDTVAGASTSSGHALTAGVSTFDVSDFVGGVDWSDVDSIELIFIGSGDTVEGSDSIQLNYFGVQSVPEPSSFALLSLGALGLCARRLRRRKAVVDTAA